MCADNQGVRRVLFFEKKSRICFIDQPIKSFLKNQWQLTAVFFMENGIIVNRMFSGEVVKLK